MAKTIVKVSVRKPMQYYIFTQKRIYM